MSARRLLASPLARQGLLPGLLAGLMGGLLSGLALSRVGALPSTASLIRSDSATIGLLIHIVVGGLLGGGFGVLVWQQRSGAGETLFWGLAYGGVWWFLGPLTFMPLLQAGFLAWDVHSAQEAFASLLGHLVYGAVTGLSLAALRRGRGTRPAGAGGAVLRGALAGLLATWVVGELLDAQGQVAAFAAQAAGTAVAAGGWSILLVGGILIGATFALLYPAPPDRTGPGLIRGTVYGFFWWVAGVLTLLPLAGGRDLPWSLDRVRAAFVTLPAALLLGAVTVLGYQWLDGLIRLLFSDVRAGHDEEGVGTEGLRAVGRGAVAGLAGGAFFAILMARIGALPTVAQLVGASSATAGVIVHLIVAQIIGAGYGLLFRRQSYDLNSAVGWGVSYGFFWWLVGPLTLMPVLLGTPPRWTAEAAGAMFPSLIGHLAYGAVLGIVFHLLEARQNPWWIPRTRAEAERISRRKEQLLTSAPALWALVVAIALVLPVLLGG